MNINRRKLVALMALAPAIAPSMLKQAFAQTAPALDVRNPTATYGQSVTYDIFRKKKKIGQHTVQFSNSGEGLVVDIESKIVVTVLKVPVFKFNYVSNELWVDGKLNRVEAATNDNGKKHKVLAERAAGEDTMQLTDKDGKAATDMVDYSSNHWNSNVVQAKKMFNTITGKAADIEYKAMGKETISLSNSEKSPIDATRYELSGKIQSELWYDDAGRWVQLRFKGEDGNYIEYRCKGFNS